MKNIDFTIEDKNYSVPIINPKEYTDWKKLQRTWYKLQGIFADKKIGDGDRVFNMYEVLVDNMYEPDLKHTLDNASKLEGKKTVKYDNWYQPGIPIMDITITTYNQWSEVFIPASQGQNKRKAKTKKK